MRTSGHRRGDRHGERGTICHTLPTTTTPSAPNSPAPIVVSPARRLPRWVAPDTAAPAARIPARMDVPVSEVAGSVGAMAANRPLRRQGQPACRRRRSRSAAGPSPRDLRAERPRRAGRLGEQAGEVIRRARASGRGSGSRARGGLVPPARASPRRPPQGQRWRVIRARIAPLAWPDRWPGRRAMPPGAGHVPGKRARSGGRPRATMPRRPPLGRSAQPRLEVIGPGPGRRDSGSPTAPAGPHRPAIGPAGRRP